MTLIDEFSFPALNRAVGVMKEAKCGGVDQFLKRMEETKGLLSVADDHVRYHNYDDDDNDNSDANDASDNDMSGFLELSRLH